MKSAVELTRLKADELMLNYKIRDEESQETQEIIEQEIENNVEVQKEGDRNRLEKFKDWARCNLLALSGATITVASIVTSIVIAARRAISAGVRATEKFAK